MSAAIIANLEKLLGGPRDNALLRYSLGNELLKAGDAAAAVQRFREAVDRDPHFSAAWKLLGKALSDAGDAAGALAAYEAGIAVADARGDVQAAKEMTVFARRIRKALAPPDSDG
ncbi:MAG: tetratricopeptide repeat protein [Rhodocyclales bacterium]|nr:tetratricopeptide repeat protein [Rhodocyclales bacterium]